MKMAIAWFGFLSYCSGILFGVALMSWFDGDYLGSFGLCLIGYLFAHAAGYVRKEAL
jgi:hypothetical protein